MSAAQEQGKSRADTKQEQRQQQAPEDQSVPSASPVPEDDESDSGKYILFQRSDDDADLRPAHVACHARKSKADATAIAKAKRVASKHSGAHRPRSTFATARSGGWRKPINGNAVRRNDA